MATTRPLVALVDTTGKVSFEYLQKLAKAIQYQVTQDVKPVWNVDADVVAYRTDAEIPFGAWKTTIMDKLDIDVYGYHYVDEKGLPYAVLRYGEDYTLTVSHEIIEMLIDPYGDRVISAEEFCCEDCMLGKQPAPAEVQGGIEILVEVADPSQHINFGYKIWADGENIRVSDFYYPSYFDLTYKSGTKYSHTGAITRPKEILSGGYASFRNRLGEWWQVFNVSGKLIYKKVGEGTPLSSVDVQTVLTGVLWGLGALFFIILIEKGVKRLFKRKSNG
jgi:hypothetical protein